MVLGYLIRIFYIVGIKGVLFKGIKNLRVDFFFSMIILS